MRGRIGGMAVPKETHKPTQIVVAAHVAVVSGLFSWLMTRLLIGDVGAICLAVGVSTVCTIVFWCWWNYMQGQPWKPRFSLRNLLVATTLAAIALGLVVWSIR